MKKIILSIMQTMIIGFSAFAEDIPVQISCDGPKDMIVRSATNSDMNLMFNKKTMLIVGDENFIIQNQAFDLKYADIARMTGKSQTQDYGRSFELMINFTSQKGSIEIGNRKMSSFF